MSVVLIIEDDASILRGLSLNLSGEGYKVLEAWDGKTGYETARSQTPDLIILDLMLPKMSGYEVCRKLRAEGCSIPIMMLTARSEETDLILGFDLGADDYVSKPFSIQEVLVRVRALLRRHQPPPLSDVVHFDDVSVDFRKFEATRSGRPVDLTRKEFGILRRLTARPGDVFTREDLLNEVWGLEKYPTTRTVDNHISSLRTKLEADPAAPRRLLTVHGVGYKFLLS